MHKLVAHFSFEAKGAKEKLTKETPLRVSRSSERDKRPTAFA
jgi:hypothetical protein